MDLRNLPGNEDKRLMALDVRPRSFGFIVLDGLTVLDCGGRSCRHRNSVDCLGARFRRLVGTYSPSIVLIRSRSIQRSRRNTRGPLTRVIQAAAKDLAIPVLKISPAGIKEYFLAHQAVEKHEIARVAASFLPELAWKLPPKRKAWEKEHYQVSVFDAAAIALAHIKPSPNETSSVA